MDERLAREVAVAVVKTEGLDANGRVRITREAQAMARLGDDPAIVTVYDVGEEVDGTPYIASQYMAGGSLDEHLDRAPSRRFPVRDALHLAEQLARGLAHAHQLSIVHRDLKPANVWLDGEGAVGALFVRMGIHRGEVIREADDFFGRTVIIGARVAASAGGGEVLVTDDVRDAAQDLHSFGAVRELSLKGLSERCPAAPLLWSAESPGL